MSRRTVISGSLTLLLALVVWWLADAMVSTPPPGDAGNSREEARAAQASSAEAAQPLPSASVQSATDREAVTVFDASAPDIVWSDVRIVDGASGVAVADAEVGCLDGAAWERLMAMPAAEREALLGDTWRCVAEFGRSVRSDDAGRARVRLDRSVTVHARHAGSYGRLVVVRDTDVPPGGHQLELWPERGMQVVVRDASGQPAVAVPLVVTMHAASGEALGDYGLWPAPQTHAPDGVARFEHMQGWRPSDELAAPIAAWRVGVALPGLREVAATFDPAAPPPAPIVLQLPPAGEVVARVVMQGRVVHLSHGFTLGLDEPERGGATRTREAIADAAGAAHFEQVPVHGRFRVAAYLGGWISRVVDGPREPGQIVAVDIEVDPADHVLIGRLLDPDGVALTKASVTMQFDLGGASARCNFVTDAGGRFAWRFRDLPHDPVDLSRADLRVDVGDRPPLRAVVPPRRLGRGVNDVGELRTEQVEVVVTGTWRGLDRLDRSEVRLQVERFAAGEDGAATSWWPVGGLTPRLFADGRFAVYGSVEPARLRLRALARSFLPIAPIEFAPGCDDLHLAFVRGASLAAYVRLPDPMAPGLFATLTPVDVPQPLAADEGHRLRAEPISGPEGTRRLPWFAIPPGRYRLDIRLLAEDQPVATIDDVEVPQRAGGDPRLREIDLRDRIHIVTLHDASWSHPLVFPEGPEAAAELRGYEIQRGELALPTLREAPDVLVVCQGYQPVQLRGVRDRVEVKLEPWPLVELRFAGLVAVPGVTLRAALVPLEDADPRRYRVAGRSGAMAEFFRAAPASVPVEDGRAALPIGVGPHRLTLSLQIPGWLESVDLPHGLPVPVAGPGTIEVPVDPGAIRAAIERLGSGTGSSGTGGSTTGGHR